ncbi:MAG TPA: carotenoid biosynthesis protein, partial [Candidatus Methylomirabilis sp.]|nr:carotenoid biosynthesis protein [Candidatus Methylomirabilis sp.]
DLIDIPRLLWGSLILRPYVFAFLLLHLAGASALLGWRRTAAFTLITWGVALAAEHSSIRTGIPFGWYYYVPRTADRELWIAGVPFFDSLSFSFLLVASYGLAWFLLADGDPKRNFRCQMSDVGLPDPRSGRPLGVRAPSGCPTSGTPRPGRLQHLILASLLFVLVDVVIDPVALRGDRWFLGQIYGYPEPGVYFGVPLANFLGWGVVGVTATALYHIWEGRLPELGLRWFCGRAALCPGLYFIVLVFNLAVTDALGEWRLLLSGVILTLPIFLWTAGILVSPRALGWWPRAAGTRARGAGA